MVFFVSLSRPISKETSLCQNNLYPDLVRSKTSIFSRRGRRIDGKNCSACKLDGDKASPGLDNCQSRDIIPAVSTMHHSVHGLGSVRARRERTSPWPTE